MSADRPERTRADTPRPAGERWPGGAVWDGAGAPGPRPDAGHDPAQASATEPLAGVRVVELGHMIAGPFATLLLSYFGAEVIKVESRYRMDGFRRREAATNYLTRAFGDFNRNKRSLTLNLQQPRGRELLGWLLARSDALLENFSARVLPQWGLDWPTLHRLYPRLVVVRMQGLGGTGPHRDFVTFGPSILALTGFTALWNAPDTDEVVGSQTAHADYIAGVHAAVALLAGLHHRARTGEGLYVDLSQAEATAALLGPAYLEWLLLGREARPVGNTRREYAPGGCYRCAGEDEWCVITVRTEAEWEALVRATGCTEWALDPRFRDRTQRTLHRQALDAALEAWTRPRPAAEVVRLLRAAGVAAGQVKKGSELLADPHLRARGFIHHVDHPAFRPISYPGAPVRLVGHEAVTRRPAPTLGQDTEAVLRDVLGLSAEEIARYRAEEVLV